MTPTDPLDGFRAPVAAIARQLETLDDDAPLWQSLYLADAAKGIMRGVAQRKDIAKVMAMMIAQCEMDTQMLCQRLLDCTDLNTEAARKAHFDARISAGILGRLNQYIHDGERAAEAINNKGESA
jgi:hypothetical protein